MDKSAITFTCGSEWWLERVTTRGRQRYPKRILVGELGRERVYVPERTCHPTYTRERWECDTCGCMIRPGFMPESHGVGVLRYCPSCGARVVSGDD